MHVIIVQTKPEQTKTYKFNGPNMFTVVTEIEATKKLFQIIRFVAVRHWLVEYFNVFIYVVFQLTDVFVSHWHMSSRFEYGSQVLQLQQVKPLIH